MSAGRSVLLVHGAGSGPWVFDAWPPFLPESKVEAVDLQEAVDPALATMSQYAAVVERASRPLPRPRVLVGWSMGGLVSMMASACADILVLLEASAPSEVQGFHPDVALVPGVFDPEREYGPFPSGMRARAESTLARAERKRGISVPTISCPLLVVYGDEFPDERGRRLAAYYRARELSLPGTR